MLLKCLSTSTPGNSRVERLVSAASWQRSCVLCKSWSSGLCICLNVEQTALAAPKASVFLMLSLVLGLGCMLVVLEEGNNHSAELDRKEDNTAEEITARH